MVAQVSPDFKALAYHPNSFGDRLNFEKFKGLTCSLYAQLFSHERIPRNVKFLKLPPCSKSRTLAHVIDSTLSHCTHIDELFIEGWTRLQPSSHDLLKKSVREKKIGCYFHAVGAFTTRASILANSDVMIARFMQKYPTLIGVCLEEFQQFARNEKEEDAVFKLKTPPNILDCEIRYNNIPQATRIYVQMGQRQLLFELMPEREDEPMSNLSATATKVRVVGDKLFSPIKRTR